MRRNSLQPLESSPRASTYRQPFISSRRYEKMNNPSLKHNKVELTDIYFNEEIRKTHIRDIIDSYFQTHLMEQPQHKTIEVPAKNISIRRRSSLISRNIKQNLSNTCPQQFASIGNSEVVEIDSAASLSMSDQQTLPPIVEAVEDPEASQSRLVNMSLSTLIEEAKCQERSRQLENSMSTKRSTKIIAENELSRVLLLYYGHSRLPVSMVKQYRIECRQIFIREQKVWALLQGLDIRPMWSATSNLMCQARPFKSLKSQLMQITKESAMSESIYKIILKANYEQLFVNDNQSIKVLVREVCRQLKAVTGKIINNKISLANLFEDGGDVTISEWGHSAIIQSLKVGSETVQSKVTPILKGFKEWLVTPEYLPPELLQHISGQSQYDMWAIPSATDIWSLGCLLLQLIILVPLWSPLRCQISTRPGFTRKGLFNSKARDLPEIIAKQRKFCSNLKLNLDRFTAINARVSPIIIDMTIKMLQIDPRKRPTPQQVLNMLK